MSLHVFPKVLVLIGGFSSSEYGHSRSLGHERHPIYDLVPARWQMGHFADRSGIARRHNTPLLKESIQLLEGGENLDVDGQHKGAVLFSGTKVLQAGMGSARQIKLTVQTGVVLRTGFRTA